MELTKDPFKNEKGKKVFINEMNILNEVGDSRSVNPPRKEKMPNFNVGLADSFMEIFGYTRVNQDE